MAFGDSRTTCCDVSQLGDAADCTAHSNNRRKKRAMNDQVQGKNRPLDGTSDYTYYILSASPSSNGPLYMASERSPPFSSRCKILIKCITNLDNNYVMSYQTICDNAASWSFFLF